MMAEKIRPKDRSVHGREEKGPAEPFVPKLERQTPRSPRSAVVPVGGGESNGGGGRLRTVREHRGGGPSGGRKEHGDLHLVAEEPYVA